jgi:D-alanyl-D-alanine carboxypeptidase
MKDAYSSHQPERHSGLSFCSFLASLASCTLNATVQPLHTAAAHSRCTKALHKGAAFASTALAPLRDIAKLVIMLRNLRRVTAIASAAAALVLFAGCATSGDGTADEGSKAAKQSSKSTTAKSDDQSPGAGESLSAEPAEDDTDIDSPDSYQVVVNKLRPLDPKTYEPDDLKQVPGIESVHGHPMRAKAADAASKMLHAAQEDGAGTGVVQSGYRSYDTQVQTYGNLEQSQGRKAADLTSARPGFSEHQTGLAFDVDDKSGCVLDACFADTDLGVWLAEHSWEYGFILRYPKDMTSTTGYEFEPWHFRYVEPKVAKDMHDRHIATLEEYFDLKAASDYENSANE